MEITIHSDSEYRTRSTGRYFSRLIENGNLIFLNGELGAGKTTFVSGIAEGLGLKNGISSPSFTILNVYKISKKASIVHADFYRLNSFEEAAGTGIEDFLYDPKYIIIVEWPDIMKAGIKKEFIEIYFSYEIEDYNKRLIKFTSSSRYWDRKLALLGDYLKKCIF
jgi:tRNA threonylcarbamoyladenosine biosynthesis protein TsaE